MKKKERRKASFRPRFKKKRKQEHDQEKKESTNLTKKTRYRLRKKENNQDLDQGKKASLRSYLFSFINSQLCARN